MKSCKVFCDLQCQLPGKLIGSNRQCFDCVPCCCLSLGLISCIIDSNVCLFKFGVIEISVLETWNKCIPCGATSESSCLEVRLECLECLSLIVLASFFCFS